MITVKFNFNDPYGGRYIEHMATFQITLKNTKHEMDEVEKIIGNILEKKIDDGYGLIILNEKHDNELLYSCEDYCNLCALGHEYPDYTEIPLMIISYIDDKLEDNTYTVSDVKGEIVNAEEDK
jgi:hypothetical protein